MYAKLFSRITESSLMEEEIDVRYTFVLLLAIADQKGYVVGTDVAISRRLNMKLDHFKRCIARLMEPDPDSNSQEEEGRRVLKSDIGRGYQLVNYVVYRDTKNENQRREYMRNYMKDRRKTKKSAPLVNHVNLTLTHTEAEADTAPEAKANADALRKGEGRPAGAHTFVPMHRYPESEEEMHSTLQEAGIWRDAQHDHNFFEQMASHDWHIDGEPVLDWIATYTSRVAANRAKEIAPEW